MEINHLAEKCGNSVPLIHKAFFRPAPHLFLPRGERKNVRHEKRVGIDHTNNPGFGRSVYIRLWKLHVTYSSYQGNLYLALMWA